MLQTNRSILAIFSFIIILAFTACSDSSTSADDSTAIINGTVENGTSQGKAKASENNSTSGTVVSAARVTSGGSFETLNGTETEADASGNFSLEVDATLANRIIIIAETEGETLMGYMAASIENGSSYTLKPVNIESTVETEVYAQLFAENVAETIHKADIETVINSNAAAQINSNSSAIAQVSTGLANSANARAELLNELEGADYDAKLNQYLELMNDVQFQYESNLAANGSASERQAAFDAFLDAKLNTYTEAGIDVATVAKLSHLKVNVIQNSLTTASTQIKNNVKASTSLFAAVAIDNAVRARAEASGMSQTTISAIADAGSSLRAEVSSNLDSASKIDEAFEIYHGEVRAAIENDASTEAAVVITIDTEINSVGGAKLLFETSISGVINAGSLSEIYADFINSVHSSVESKSDTIGEIEAEALADIMILINLFS